MRMFRSCSNGEMSESCESSEVIRTQLSIYVFQYKIVSILFTIFSSNTVNAFESTVRVQFRLLLRRSRKRWRSTVMSMSVCVCLSAREHISGTTRAIFTKFLCMLPMAVARSSSGRVTKFQEEAAVLRVFPPLAMHCNALAANNIMQQKGSFPLHWGR